MTPDLGLLLPVGSCDHCGLDILAPRDVLVWADGSTYHQTCHRTLSERKAAERAAERTTPTSVDAA